MKQNLLYNNPFSIGQSDIEWVGKTKIQDSETIVSFTQMQWGIRAQYLIVAKLIKQHRIRLLRDLLNEMLPEEDREACGNLVCSLTTFQPNTLLDIGNKNTSSMILYAIAAYLNGETIPMNHFLNGWALAFRNRFDEGV